MFIGMALMACPHLAVPTEVMRHVVEVESGSNPYAIGVVGGQLVRQPQNLGEALATVHMLDAKGYNFSLGVAQVNRANLGKYGLDSYEKAFEPCPNLSAGARILSECYANSGGDWGKSFSCYYSGNFVTGFRDGYVQKVYDSINRSARTTGNADAAQAIPLQVAARPASATGTRNIVVPMTAGSAAYRLAIRSVALDTAAAALVPTVAAALAPASKAAAAAPQEPPQPANPPATTTAPVAATTPAAAAGAETTDIFVPQVHGPNDAPAAPTPTDAAPQAQVAATPAPAAPAADRADLRLENRDAAFVF